MKNTQPKGNLTTKDLDAIGGLLDKQAAVLATKEELKELASKDDLKNLGTDLKQYINEGIETVTEGINSISEQLAEKEKLEKLVEWAREAGDKIGVKPKI